MDSNKGFIKWLAGFLILGTIIGYLIVMSGQQKNDILISRDGFNEKVLEFDKDFYQTQADITINTESKERLLSNADKIDKELEKIKTEKEEKIKRQKELEEEERRIKQDLENKLRKIQSLSGGVSQVTGEDEKEINKTEKEDFFIRFN
ncbi:hypothetical protein [Aliarcobacter cryaerophilus]|uniref:hypothetical protein n=1 Tax=Aliarcobacter cryaerophilus TaxID=28198 RepID=UPI0021B4C87C|nr:hypothetical protein [Aliarcobacter cryaerophilus]MCT7510945.1 hypothetical protein [Aliarcobacter cryaerophilus]